MYDPDNHILLFYVRMVRCREGHEIATHDTDHGHCGCGGWEVWARTRAEIEVAYQHHLSFLQQTQKSGFTSQPQTPPQVQPQHELKWLNAQSGYCSWCDWRLSGMTREKIEAAFSVHLTNPTGYKTY